MRAEVRARVPLRRIELLKNGEVIETYEVGAAAEGSHLDKTLMVDRSSWFAVRVLGRPARGIPSGGIPRAHSGAIYVLADGKPVLVRQDLELMLRWIDRLWAYIEERNNLGPGVNRERAREMFERARQLYRERLNGLGG